MNRYYPYPKRTKPAAAVRRDGDSKEEEGFGFASNSSFCFIDQQTWYRAFNARFIFSLSISSRFDPPPLPIRDNKFN